MQCFLGLGSNIQPREHLAAGLATLDQRFGLVSVSPLYRSPAWGFDGADFLNMVVSIDTELTARALASTLRSIEFDHGRPEVSSKFSDRRLDIDLLLLGDLQCHRPRLPRPDVLKRDFVLCPLADIAPSLCHPVTGCNYAWHWDRYRRQHGCQLQRQERIDFVHESTTV